MAGSREFFVNIQTDGAATYADGSWYRLTRICTREKTGFWRIPFTFNMKYKALVR